jgi:hypothetical protein
MAGPVNFDLTSVVDPDLDPVGSGPLWSDTDRDSVRSGALWSDPEPDLNRPDPQHWILQAYLELSRIEMIASVSLEIAVRTAHQSLQRLSI